MSILDAALAFLLLLEHFGGGRPRRPERRALDLRGFRMTRREAARWLDAIDPPDADDSHPTRGDFCKVATRDELLHWSRTNRGPEPRSRAICALYLAAWRGPDFWRPVLCVMRCGRPATRAPEWEPDAGAVYCDECDSDGPEVPEAPRLRALWRLARSEQ